MSRLGGSSSFHGREEELRKLRDWFDYAKNNRKPVFSVIVADSGLGKTRLVQELYHALSKDLDPNSYWPPAFGDSGDNLQVNPKLENHQQNGTPGFIWLGTRFLEPDKDKTPRPILDELKNLARKHLSLSEILKHDNLPKQIMDDLRRRGKQFVNENISNQAENILAAGITSAQSMEILTNLAASQLEHILDYAADTIPVLKPLKSSYKDVSKRRRAGKSKSPQSYMQKEYGEEALDQLTRDMEGFEMPIILWLDDAQWIDQDSLVVIKKLLGKAKKRKFTIMIIATHWQGNWNVNCDEDKGIAPLFIFNVDKEKVQNFNEGNEDSKNMYVDDSESIMKTILKLDRLQDGILREIIQDNLPGVEEDQQTKIVEKVKGHVLGLMELLGKLIEDKLYINGKLSPDGEKYIKNMRDTRTGRATQIFEDLEYGEKVLLSYGSASGTPRGFRESVVCDAANSLFSNEFAGEFKEYNTLEGLEKLGRRRLLANERPEIWEFRDNVYYPIASSFYESQKNILGKYSDYLDKTIKTDSANRIKSCFDSSGELIDHDGFLTEPPEDRIDQLQRACKSLAGGRMPESSDEPSDFRARCLLVREYAMAHMGKEAQGEGANLKECAWEEKGKDSYVHRLGANFRWELCNRLVDVQRYDVALAIARNLEIWYGDICYSTDENKVKLAESKKKYADIIVKWDTYSQNNSVEKNDLDWAAAEHRCEEAKDIFEDQFGQKEKKDAKGEIEIEAESEEYYKHMKDCNMLLSRIIHEKTGDRDKGVGYRLAAQEYIKDLCKYFDTPENQKLLAGVHLQIGEIYKEQGKWPDAKDEFGKRSEILSNLCGADSNDYGDDIWKRAEKELKDHTEAVAEHIDYELFEDYVDCLDTLKEICRNQNENDDAERYSKLCLKTIETLVVKAYMAYQRGERNNLVDFCERYGELAHSFAKDDENKKRDKQAEDKIERCKVAWKKCCDVLQKDRSDGSIAIAGLRKQAQFLHEWGIHQYDQAKKDFGELNEIVKKAANIRSELDDLTNLNADDFSRKESRNKVDSAKSDIEKALEKIKETEGRVKVATTLLKDCEEVRHDISERLKLPEHRKEQAETMLLLVEVLYDQYSWVGPPDQAGGDIEDMSPDKAAKVVEASMGDRISSIFRILDDLRKEFVEEGKRIKNRTEERYQKVEDLKAETRRGCHKDLYRTCQELRQKFSEYDRELHEAQTQKKLKVDHEAISKKRKLQALIASIPLGIVLILWALSTSFKMVDVVVRTAKPAPVSWETIEGGAGRLFGRTWLWTDAARVRASAPGHQSAEAVLSKDGSGGFELVLEPMPGVAEIDIVGEGPITLSVDGVAQQAQPSMRMELAHGPHRAFLTGPNIVPTEIDFDMQGFGNVQQFQWAAASANSFLDVRVQPQTAEVLLNGQPWAVGSRKAGVPVGRHTLSASIPGWYSKSEEFDAVVDNVASFHWTLRPKPAVLALSTEPSGVSVLLNGDYVGQSPVSLNLPANKRHVISARQSGRDPVELALSPAPGERLNRTLRLEARTAKVAFSASGPATVRVNGIHSGTLPLTVELREGDRVEAVADGLAAAPYIVTKLESVTGSHRFQLMPPDKLAHRSAPELEEVLPGLRLKRIPWSAMGATVSRPFRIAVHEVTYAAYSELLAQTPPSGLTAQHPVVNISWTQAAQFTNALSVKHGLPPVYVFDRSGYLLSVNQQSLGFRLPTEAEWLAAAGPGWARPKGAVRPNWAGSERRSGLRMPGHTDRWLELAPAQQAVLGAFDLRGMAGNAAEWLHDYYAPWPSAPPPGYAGPALGIDHAVRGGSYLTAEKPEARGFSAKGRPDLGFRVAQWLY